MDRVVKQFGDEPYADVGSERRRSGLTDLETIELKMSKVRGHTLNWCTKRNCNHKNCSSVNLIITREEWAEWCSRHSFCPTCRRKD